MTEQTPTAPTSAKKRGVTFPQLSLEAAVEAVVAMGQHGADHSQDAAAAYLGHSTTNSGAYRVKLAALRDWGLIKRGDKERVILSDLAKDIVLEAPDHAQARSLLLAAFESCRVFEQLYEDSAKNIPQDLGRFRNVVVVRHNVATDQADRFIDCFVDSAGYAGLAKVEGNQVTLLTRDTTAWEDERQKADELIGPFTPPSVSNAPTPPQASDASWRIADQSGNYGGGPDPVPVALRQTWPINGGEIEFVIRTPKALPPAIYAVVAEMAGVAAKMEELLKPPTVEAPASPVGDNH